MNAPRVPLGMTSDVIARILIWLWLLGLSVAVVLGSRAVNQLAEQIQATVESQQVLALEARVAELAGSVQALEAKPEPASAADLLEAQQTLLTRIADVEQRQTNFTRADDVQALRSEMEQIKARQAVAVRTTPPPAPRRVPKPAVVIPQPEPFPYRVLGAERRAGLRSISVALLAAPLSTGEIQVLLSGETIGAWRLQAIEGNTAIFQSGEQIRRITIPNGSVQ